MWKRGSCFKDQALIQTSIFEIIYWNSRLYFHFSQAINFNETCLSRTIEYHVCDYRMVTDHVSIINTSTAVGGAKTSSDCKPDQTLFPHPKENQKKAIWPCKTMKMVFICNQICEKLPSMHYYKYLEILFEILYLRKENSAIFHNSITVYSLSIWSYYWTDSWLLELPAVLDCFSLV